MWTRGPQRTSSFSRRTDERASARSASEAASPACHGRAAERAADGGDRLLGVVDVHDDDLAWRAEAVQNAYHAVLRQVLELPDPLSAEVDLDVGVER